MKTKAKITGLKNIEKSTLLALRQGVGSKEVLNDVGQYVTTNLIGNARQGKTNEGTSFDPISKSWIKRKAALADVNNTDEFYKKNKSNLTFTGQLLRSISYRIYQGTLTLGIYFKGNRKPYKGIRKAELDGPATNAELAEQIEKTRPFMFISEKMNKVLVNRVIRGLKRSLKNYKRISKLLR